MTPEQLYENNQKLVYYSIIKTFKSMKYAASIARKKYMQYEDIEQMAKLALWKAAIQFDPELGFKFNTYAVAVIKSTLMVELNRRGSLVKIPRNDKDPERQKLMEKGIRTTYFSEPQDNGLEFADTLPGYDPTPSMNKKLHLEDLLSMLTELEATILRMKLTGLTQKEISVELGINVRKINRMFGGALAKLNPDYREYLRAN